MIGITKVGVQWKA